MMRACGGIEPLMRKYHNRSAGRAQRPFQARKLRGRKYIDPAISRLLKEDPPAPELTERQREIMKSVTDGLTNDQIADLFGITSDGVKGHLTAIFRKIGATSRGEAIAIALRKHLLKI